MGEARRYGGQFIAHQRVKTNGLTPYFKRLVDINDQPFFILDTEGYPWEWPVRECYPLSILGVGTTGLAIVAHLYQLGLRDVRFVICYADEAWLRASPVPVRLSGTSGGECLC
ncbi:hypothetical protein [Spirosoma aerophilum]